MFAYKILINFTDWDKSILALGFCFHAYQSDKYLANSDLFLCPVGWRVLLFVLLFLLWLPSGFPGLLASVMAEHTFKQDFNYQVISPPTSHRQVGRKVLQSMPQTFSCSSPGKSLFSFLSEDAQVMLMASYSSDKDDDHLISMKFHFCPLSISSCRAGTGRLRWDARQRDVIPGFFILTQKSIFPYITAYANQCSLGIGHRSGFSICL